MKKMRMQPGTWFMAPKLMYDMAEVSGTARWVYGYLCYLADDKNTAFPSYAKIKEACGIGGRTRVSNAIKELIEAGLIKKETRFRRGGGQRSNLYTIMTNIDDIDPLIRKVIDMLGNVTDEKKEAAMELISQFLGGDGEGLEGKGPQGEGAGLPDDADTYGHNREVHLKDREYMGLVREFGAHTVADYIEQLDSYIASSGDRGKYPNHYATLRRWILRDIKKGEPRSSRDKDETYRRMMGEYPTEIL